MKHLPKTFLQSLQGVNGFDREAFLRVHQTGEQVTSVRINPHKISESLKVLPFGEDLGGAVLWSRYGYYLQKRPSFTFDPFFHAGTYYVQEASSMFLEQAITQLADLSKPLKVLDVCAAPGGKSTHLQSLISSDSLLVSNEVIKSRSNVLVDNIIKWGSYNFLVTNNDPAAFQKLPGYFDVIVVDAPCSGSGLFRKNEDAIDEWNWNNVQLCCQRQQRILADVLPALKHNGLLFYSTCSYSIEEDEDIADWLVREMKMENEKLEIKNEWNIVKSESPATKTTGYRFFPDKVKGEGFFLACFRKTSSSGSVSLKTRRPELISTREKKIVDEFVDADDLVFIKNSNVITALQENLLEGYTFIKTQLNVRYAGVKMGEVMKEKLVPHHALALSTIISESVPDVSLEYDEAIKFLQRQEPSIQPANTGWQTVSYKKMRLGWINALKNRINNYYPKELRILKQHNDSAF